MRSTKKDLPQRRRNGVERDKERVREQGRKGGTREGTFIRKSWNSRRFAVFKNGV